MKNVIAITKLNTPAFSAECFELGENFAKFRINAFTTPSLTGGAKREGNVYEEAFEGELEYTRGYVVVLYDEGNKRFSIGDKTPLRCVEGRLPIEKLEVEEYAPLVSMRLMNPETDEYACIGTDYVLRAWSSSDKPNVWLSSDSRGFME